MALKCALICFFKRGWIPYSEERRILRLDQRILPIHMYNLRSTRRRVCKGFPFTRSLPGICWLMIVEMMAHFSGILVREWLPNHGFFFFSRDPPSVVAEWMKIKRGHPHIQWHSSWQSGKPGERLSWHPSAGRQGAQVPSLSTQKNVANVASRLHPIALPVSWAISAVFLVNKLTELYRNHATVPTVMS